MSLLPHPTAALFEPAIRRLLACVIVLAGALWSNPSSAIGPTLPLRFEDLQEIRDPWTASLLVDPEQIRVTRIERHIYADGERLHVEPIEMRPEKQSSDRRAESRLLVPLQFKEIEKFKQRHAFAQAVIVEGKWLKEASTKPLQLQRWFYFISAGDKIRRVDLDEYSNFTDRAEVDISSQGRQALVHRGRDRKAAVPLSETKSTAAIQVGPLGGATEESVPAQGKQPAQEADRSEVNEK